MVKSSIGLIIFNQTTRFVIQNIIKALKIVYFCLCCAKTRERYYDVVSSSELKLSGQELVSRYSRDLDLSEDVVSKALESLRQHAVNRLAADTQFSQTGVATLHVKFAGQLPANVSRCHALSFKFNEPQSRFA